MEYHKKIGKISQSPTNPGARRKGQHAFDIAELYSGAVSTTAAEPGEIPALDEKMRKAYFWITNNAIITPFYDIEYSETPPGQYRIGDSKSLLTLPADQSYSSFILLPLLNLVVRRRCLFIGGPGRGKTASAILMGLLAGYSLKELKRSIQHGQPQMTISDLLGNPVPADLMNSDNLENIRISWRKWLGMRVKVIDEYNRIPTRTQSALLTVMGDNYAELLDQVYECPDAAWYLTANDDAGGGTYQVIEALRDRIDVVVRALHFNSRFLGELLTRIETGVKPEEMIPPEIIFTAAEIEQIEREIRQVEIPPPLLRRIEFFAAQFELCEPAGQQFEYKTKDNVKLSNVDFQQLTAAETGKDKLMDIGYQTKNGLSVRAFMTCLVFIKALAYFRGEPVASFEDVRQILPFVLHDKLVQNSDAVYFEQPANTIYRIDRISWLRRLFSLSCAEYDKQGLDKVDTVGTLLQDFSGGLEGVSREETEAQLVKIERQLGQYAQSGKLYGPLFDDILTLKYLHQRYTNYLKWLNWKQA